MKRILFATSEAVPFIKTGGLADVAGALPKCFDKRYFDVRVILPKYACMKQEWKDKMEYITHFYMDLGYKNCYVGIMHMEYEGIQFYFIDNEYYFSGPKPYDSAPWDLEKFAFFSKAVLSVLPVIGFRPDVIHCHDWQTGLVPVYLHDSYIAVLKSKIHIKMSNILHFIFPFLFHAGIFRQDHADIKIFFVKAFRQ